LNNVGIGEIAKVDKKADSPTGIHEMLWKNEYDFQRRMD
jgi:hypothetical protein